MNILLITLNNQSIVSTALHCYNCVTSDRDLASACNITTECAVEQRVCIVSQRYNRAIVYVGYSEVTVFVITHQPYITCVYIKYS